jgi:putative endopeptidase
MKAPFLFRAALLLLLVTACSDDSDPRRTPPASAGLDETVLDRTADPCANFYQFACGNWLAEHPPVSGYAEERFGNVSSRNDIFFNFLLEGEIDGDVPVGAGIRAARTYLDACVQARGGKKDDLSPIGEVLGEIAKLRTKEDLPRVLAALHDDGVGAFFSAGPSTDFGDPTRRILWLGDRGKSLPTRESYDDSGELGEPYRAHMKTLSALFPTAAIDPDVVWDVEKKIAAASPTAAVERDPTLAYNPKEVSTLPTIVPSFEWGTYFELRGFGQPTWVSLEWPDYFTALEGIFADTPLEGLRQYLVWRVLEAYADSASSRAIAEERDFHEGLVLGRKQARTDEFACFLETRSIFGTSLARAFVARYDSQEQVRRAGKLVDRIRASLRTTIEAVDWLDDDTRAQALGKLDAMNTKVGLPEKWDASNEPEAQAGMSYARLTLDAARLAYARAARRLLEAVDRNEWVASPATVNAFYNPTTNDITLPVAILADPFFSASWTDSTNSGALGSLIGHEMTHGFDDQGRHFDATGKLVKWWSETTDAEFRHRAECLVDEFGSFEPLPGRHIDGELTLGENIADLGGLKLAYEAFTASGERDSPVASFDADQAFFVSYAQLWCANESPELLTVDLGLDPHSPPEYRVNGVVKNLPAFARAFSCRKGAELAPADRCEVW